MAMLAPKKNLVEQINAIISQELLHGKATFYPVLAVQVVIENPPDIPRNF